MDFTIVSAVELGRGHRGRPVTLAVIWYVGATEYNGRKMSLYECAPEDLRTATGLDPHFCERGGLLVPVARFEPTVHGLVAALGAARGIGVRNPPGLWMCADGAVVPYEEEEPF